MVYKKYKHIISEKKIFLQHEYEEFDEVAKMVAYEHLMTFCTSVESVINAFSVDLYKLITDSKEEPLTIPKIKHLCSTAFDESHYPRYFVFRETKRKLINETGWREFDKLQEIEHGVWKDLVSKEILLKISKKGDMKCTEAWSEIWKACRKTVEDLGIILRGLKEFRTRVLPSDQNKRKMKI